MNKRDKFIIVLLIIIAAILLLSNISAVAEPFKKINDIMTPIYIGFILAFLLNPLVKVFERKVYFKVKSPTLNRTLSIITSFVVVLGVLTGFGFLVVPQIVDSAKDLIRNGPVYINDVITSVNKIMIKLNITPSEGGLTLESVLAKVLSLFSSLSSTIVKSVMGILSSALDVITNILVGIFVSIYVLFSKERLSAGARRITKAIFPKKVSEKILLYSSVANKKFGGYVMGNMLDCCMIGLVGLIIFSIFGIPYAALISLIIGCTNFIPFFGPFIGGIPSAFIILIADPSKVIPFIIMIIVMQQIDGNFIQPKIIGDKTGLTSLGVISAITLMGGIFGFPGLVIGAPITAMFIVMVEDYLQFKLKSKNLPVDLEKYYDPDDLVKLSDLEKEHFINRLWKIIKNKCPIKIVKKDETPKSTEPEQESDIDDE